MYYILHRSVCLFAVSLKDGQTRSKREIRAIINQALTGVADTVKVIMTALTGIIA
jgi:hypothetical protein